jgi:hypothetical protein
MSKKAKDRAAPPAEPLDEFGLPPLIGTETVTLLTGFTPRHLHRLVEELRIPADCYFGNEKWRTAKTFQEIVGYYKRKADRTKAPTSVESELAKETLRTQRLKNAKLARELLPRHVYVQAWGELLTVFKNRFLNLADKLAPRVFRAKDKVIVAEIIDAEVREIFGGLMDPKVMEDLAAKIRDDEFEHGTDSADSSGDRAAPAGDLVAPDA